MLSDYLVVHQVHPVEKNAFLRHSQEIFISRQITGHLLIPGYRPGAIGAIMVIEQNDPVALFQRFADVDIFENRQLLADPGFRFENFVRRSTFLRFVQSKNGG